MADEIIDLLDLEDLEDGPTSPRVGEVVVVHPDRHPASWVNRFGVQGQGAYNLHLLATRGFAVFHPASPFESGRPVEGIADAVLPGVDRVVALGVADPDRIGVMGTSAGGYATIALLTRSNRWRAAIADHGFANLLVSWSNLRPDGTAIEVSYVEGYGMGLGASPGKRGTRRLHRPIALLRLRSDRGSCLS